MDPLKPSMPSSLGNGTLSDYGYHPETQVLIDELRAVKLTRSNGKGFLDTKHHTMSELGLRSLCAELARLKKASADEMCRNVYANYGAFIKTSQDWADLEREVLNMRSLLSKQADLIHGLMDEVHLNFVEIEMDVDPRSEHYHEGSDPLQDHEVLIDNIDVMIAERRVDEAVEALFEGEDIAAELRDNDQASHLQALLSERKVTLMEQLVEVAHQPSTCGRELRAVVSALHRLGDGTCAHLLLLNSHKRQLHGNVQGLRASSMSYGGAYISTLSHLVFSTLLQAARESRSLFGEETAFVSELVSWVSDEVAIFASLVERHVLVPASTTGCLHVAAECAKTVFGYCSLLENQGLAFSPALSKSLRPSIEKTLQVKVMHIKETLTFVTSTDDWMVSFPSGLADLHTSSSFLTDIKLSSSAHKFQELVQELFDDVVALSTLQLGGLLLDSCAHLFEYYVDILLKAIPEPRYENLETCAIDKLVLPAEAEHQQLGLWANVSALADEILPREQAKRQGQSNTSSKSVELREWRRRLQRSMDRWRDDYCGKQILDLFYNEDGLSNFVADVYTMLESTGASRKPMPSPIFKALFFRLNKLSHVAADVLVGRERMASLLLNKLLEVFVILILEDEAFWEGMGDVLKPLGQAGLQQFVLDMHFIIQIAAHGHYSNRRIQKVVLEIIARAVERFNTDGVDPYSVLPENEWFLEVAADCISELLSADHL